MNMIYISRDPCVKYWLHSAIWYIRQTVRELKIVFTKCILLNIATCIWFSSEHDTFWLSLSWFNIGCQANTNICIIFAQRRPNVFDVGPTLCKSYTNVLCLLCEWSVVTGHTLSYQVCGIYVSRVMTMILLRHLTTFRSFVSQKTQMWQIGKCALTLSCLQSRSECMKDAYKLYTKSNQALTY